MAGLKPLLSEFGITHRLESCTYLRNDCVVGLFIWHEHVWVLLMELPQGFSLLVSWDPGVVLLGNVDSLVSG